MSELQALRSDTAVGDNDRDHSKEEEHGLENE